MLSMLSTFFGYRLGVGVVALGLIITLAQPSDTWAAKRKKKTGSSVTFIDHGETASQREQRLRRECKGRPNAGVCLGYTR